MESMRLFALYAAAMLCVCWLSVTLAAERFGQWSLEQPVPPDLRHRGRCRSALLSMVYLDTELKIATHRVTISSGSRP